MTTQTTRELAREVAMAMGWRFEVIGLVGCTQVYRIYCPNGSIAAWPPDSRWKTETIPQYRVHQLYPDYPHDLNACARDLTREGYYPNLAKTEDGWCVVYQIDYNHYIINTRKFAKEPAVAWCESFLALQKYVKGEG